jgi:nitrous oxidase accessory protein NosD
MRRRIRVLVACAIFGGCLAGASSASATPLVCQTGCFFNSIQAAINAAQPGATVTVGAGSFYENVVVDKPLTLRGAGTSTVLYPSVSHPECPTGSSLCSGEASNIILVEASNVTVTKMWLKGDNPNLTSGVVRGGEDIDARNGIIENYYAGTFDNLTVSKVKVTGVYLRGIYASSEGNGFNFNHDTVENVQGEEESIAMFNFGGSGVMSHNKVSNANDGLSANWSRGTQFLDNTVTRAGSGLHTDNNGGAGGSADTIEGNKVSECATNGYGIFVFVPYLSATVKANKIKACAVGLAAYGGAVSGQGPTFQENTVNGTGAPTSGGGGTYGAYLTTDQLGYEYGDLTATLTGNSFTHLNTGMLVTQTSPTPGQPAGGQATVTASTGNSFYSDGTGADGEAGTVVSASNDWWGCSEGPNQGGRCNTAVGTVTFTPWLTAKP